MSRIFVSHSSNDSFEAVALKRWLASEGWDDVFLDLDPERGIAAGERWERSLHAASNRCEAVVFLITANWLASGWCRKEYELARGLNKKLFALRVDPATRHADLPPELTDIWQVVDLTSGQDLKPIAAVLPGSHEEKHVAFSQSGLARLKRGLEKAGLDPKFFAWPPTDEPDRPPYHGMKPLEKEDAGIFFGRAAPIVEATDRLRGLLAGAPPRIFVILGASGSGKSSFLRAGLLPRLARDDEHFLPLPPIRPERAALTGEMGLVAALGAVFPDRRRADLRAAAQSGAAALKPILAELVSASRARRVSGGDRERSAAVLIAVDQAEELFRAEGREESEALLTLLGELMSSDDPPVIAIFAIRSDSYEALQNAKALEGLRQEPLSLPPMPRGAYGDVIEGPARRVNEAGGKLAIEPRLTQRLLADIEAGGGSDALPLLAFTLEQLYLDYRQAGVMRLADYQGFGGLKGAIDAAVGRAFRRGDADPRIPRDREARLVLLRRGLIPWLAGVDPDSKSPRRYIARRSDIPPEAAPLIDLLIEERLLSTDARVERDAAGDEIRVATIEPTHEALLRQWGLLEGWLKADFGLLATLEGVKRAARDWDANARDAAWLAHRGQRLADAGALDERADIAAKLDAVDRGYLAGCRAKEAAEAAEAEARRKEREEEQARALRDAQAVAEANKRRTRAVAAGLLAAIVLAIAAVGFGVDSLNERRVALQETAKAKQQEALAKTNADEADRQSERATAQAAEALEQRAKAETLAKEAILQKAKAEANASSMKLLLNVYRETQSFVPAEVQSLLQRAAELLPDSGGRAGDDGRLVEVDALSEMAAYFRDAWDFDRGMDLLGRARNKLNSSPPDPSHSASFARASAKIAELAGDLSAQKNDGFSIAFYSQSLALYAALPKPRQDVSRLHRKLGDVDFSQDEFTKADAEIEAARVSLDPDGEPLDEQAALADLAARASARHGQGDAAIKGLQEAVDLDRRSLAEAKQKALPLERRMVALATNLAHLGNEMRRERLSEAGQIYDEAEQLATEVLKTYPNQLSTRFIIDLIRHSDQLIEKSGISHTSSEDRLNRKLSAVTAAFGSGVGRFKFGMTPKEVLGLTTGRPANIDVSQLGLVTEYTTDEVRFFFDYMSPFPEFQQIYADAACFRNSHPGTGDSDYVVFMFHEGELIRVSMRFQGQDAPGCQPHAALFPTLAQRFGMPLLGTPGAWRLAWDVAGASIIGTTTSLGATLDIVQR